MLCEFSFLWLGKWWCNRKFKVSQLISLHFASSHFGSSESMPFSRQNTQASKEIGIDFSILLGSSVLYWHIGRKLSVFVTTSILNLRFFVWVLFKTWIVDCAVFLYAVMADYIYLAEYIKNGLSLLPEMLTWFFSSNTTHSPTKQLH